MREPIEYCITSQRVPKHNVQGHHVPTETIIGSAKVCGNIYDSSGRSNSRCIDDLTIDNVLYPVKRFRKSNAGQLSIVAAIYIQSPSNLRHCYSRRSIT
jgi:hypothetical protein